MQAFSKLELGAILLLTALFILLAYAGVPLKSQNKPIQQLKKAEEVHGITIISPTRWIKH